VISRSATEAFLYRRLETLEATHGVFALNQALPIPFAGGESMEVDLSSPDLRLVIEIDGPQHLASADTYRRDRYKDRLLQEQEYLVIRFLAQDVCQRLNEVLDVILRAVARRRGRLASASGCSD
jgi:very-short-patch-repair endonuclease